MKVTINKKSWHYRLASFYANGGDLTWFSEPQDFCSYLEKIAKGFCMLILMMLIAIYVIIIPVGDLAAWALACAQNHMWLHIDVAAQLFAITVTIFIFLAFMLYLIYTILTWKANHSTNLLNDSPSFTSMLYAKFHDKVCFKINYKD